jgi:hypothetical protein
MVRNIPTPQQGTPEYNQRVLEGSMPGVGSLNDYQRASMLSQQSFSPTPYAAPYAKDAPSAKGSSAGGQGYYTSQENAMRYPEVERVAQERAQLESTAAQLQAQAGYGPDTAMIMAQKLLNTQKEANAIKIQEQMLAADDAQLQLTNHRQKLDARTRLNSFAQDLNKVDYKNLNSFNENLEMLQLNYLDLLSSDDEETRKTAQGLIGERINANTRAGNIAETQARKLGLPGVTPDILDENGRLNPQRALISAQQYKNQEFERKLGEEKKLAKVGEETRIAVQEAAIKARDAARARDPKIQQELKILALTEQKKVRDLLTQEYNNDIIASGISQESAKYLGREIGEGDATGRKVKDGTHYIYRDNKGKAFALPKESVDFLKNKSMEYRSLLQNIGNITSQNAQEGGQAIAPQATTGNQQPKDLNQINFGM